MNWSGWTEFFAMGGYALYVWGSYAATLALVVCEVVFLNLRKRNILRHLGHGARYDSVAAGRSA